MTTPHDDLPCCPAGSCSAVGTAEFAAALRCYLGHLERARLHPDLKLLRSAALVLQARLGCRGERCAALQRLHEFVEWEAPLFEAAPTATPAARGGDSG